MPALVHPAIKALLAEQNSGGRARTYDLRFNKPPLLPTELHRNKSDFVPFPLSRPLLSQLFAHSGSTIYTTYRRLLDIGGTLLIKFATMR